MWENGGGFTRAHSYIVQINVHIYKYYLYKCNRYMKLNSKSHRDMYKSIGVMGL